MSTLTLEGILGKTLAIQCRLDPQPDDLRALILNRLNVWVPTDQPIEEWLLANYKPKGPLPPIQATPGRGGLTVECERRGISTGRATVRADFEETGAIEMSETELLELIREAGNREEAIEQFVGWADDNEVTEDGREYSDYEYGDEDFEDDETTDSSNNARAVIEGYLNAHPELFAQDDEDEDDDDDDDDDEDDDEEEEQEVPAPTVEDRPF